MCECDGLYTTEAVLNLVHSYGNFALCGAIILRCSWGMACGVVRSGVTYNYIMCDTCSNHCKKVYTM